MLELRQVCKKFNLKQAAELQRQDPRIKGRFFHALKDFDLRFEQGEVLGLLGANGAGKTSLLRILSTALKADSGDILFEGQNIQQTLADYRRKIGFLSGTTGLYERLTGYENLAYFARLYGLNQVQLANRIKALSDLLGLKSFINRRLSDYSTGMKQRVAIARCVLHSPKLVILDEPTTGLDIVAKEVILKFIESMQADNVSIIFSTHDMAEVERLCQRVCIIDKGHNIFTGSIETLKQQTGELFLQQALFGLIHSEDATDVSLC